MRWRQCIYFNYCIFVFIFFFRNETIVVITSETVGTIFSFSLFVWEIYKNRKSQDFLYRKTFCLVNYALVV